MTATMTSHCANDRIARVQAIITNIGLGQIVAERKELSSNPRFPFKYVSITDTGVTVVRSVDKTRIITMYVTTVRELIRVYDGRANVPDKMMHIVIQNERKYIRNGKTTL